MKRNCVLLNDKLINIGDWDNQGGKNPLPTGSIVKELECKQDADGAWYAEGYKPVVPTTAEMIATENATLRKRVEAAEKALFQLTLGIKL